MTRDLARTLRADLDDPYVLVDLLGLSDGRRSVVHQARGVLIRCPWHEDRTPSCSVRTARDGTISVRCHGCGETGDALSLVAIASGLDLRRDFRSVLRRAAEFAGRSLTGLDDRPSRAPRSPRPRRLIAPAAERPYPPSDELAALLATTVDVSEVRRGSAMLLRRGFDVERVDDTRLARALPIGAALPSWATYGGRPWTMTGHRLVLPVVDAVGVVRSVRAWRVTEGTTPKRLPPAGHRASGLVLADEFATAMLRGTYAARRVVIAEGEPDFLAAVLGWGHVLAAKLGIWSGAWSDDVAARIPSGAEVLICTDADEAGDRYADVVWRSLRGRCRVTRDKAGTAA